MKIGVTNGMVATDFPISDSKVDNALTFLQQNEQVSYVLSSDEDKKLVRKIDMMLMPLMAAVFTIQYLDKTISISPKSISFLESSYRTDE